MGCLSNFEVITGFEMDSIPLDDEWKDALLEDPDWFPIIKYLSNGQVPDDKVLMLVLDLMEKVSF